MYIKFKSVFNSSLIVIAFLASHLIAADAQQKAVDSKQLSASSLDNVEISNLFPQASHHKSSRYIPRYIKDYHYKKTTLTNQESALILDKYIETLDSYKIYFLADDIKSFQLYRYAMDNAILTGQLKPTYSIYNVFQKRWVERNKYAISLLQKEMDFNKKELFKFDRKDEPWFSTEEELNEYWRKNVKNSALKLVIAGKTWDEAKDILLLRHKAAIRRISQTNSEDVFSYFMNAYTNIVDPHTSYLSPRSTEEFNSRMALSLEGIGAYLLTDDVYTKITGLVAEGPAYKAGGIEKGDKIIAIAQGDDPFVDVVGWRSNDVIDLIRGKSGSVVRLELEPENSVSGKTKIVSIVRDKITMEEQAAKSEVIQIEQQEKKYRIGIIDLPSFYIDFKARYENKKNYRSTTRDVRNLINQLQQGDGIDALLIDLRANGGGSLDEATAMTGLFIDQGPVVQDKDRKGEIKVSGDSDAGTAWDGPLAVLVNGTSASASEIFAGAIQDYGRGIIIGEQTFGKGTVQRIFDLNELLLARDGKYGSLKLTINKFYRITGESTQMRGVVPDVPFPATYPREEIGEESFESALSWDMINPVKFKKLGNFSSYLQQLNEKHQQRIKSDIEFNFILEDIAELNELRKQKQISLNIDERRAQLEADKQKKLDRENARRKLAGKPPLKAIDENTKLIEVKDSRLYEAAHVVGDLIAVQSANKLANINK